MKFRMRDVLWIMTVVAFLVTLAVVWFGGFLVAFLLANAIIIICPLAIVFTTIVFADQRGQMLDLNSNPLYNALKKAWLLSTLSAALVWIVIFTSASIN